MVITLQGTAIELGKSLVKLEETFYIIRKWFEHGDVESKMHVEVDWK